jgi:hypothetical protein
MGVRWDLSLRYRGTYTASPICPGRQYGFNTVYRLEASPPGAAAHRGTRFVFMNYQIVNLVSEALFQAGINPEPG